MLEFAFRLDCRSIAGCKSILRNPAGNGVALDFHAGGTDYIHLSNALNGKVNAEITIAFLGKRCGAIRDPATRSGFHRVGGNTTQYHRTQQHKQDVT